jgi:hypothetical protein
MADASFAGAFRQLGAALVNLVASTLGATPEYVALDRKLDGLLVDAAEQRRLLMALTQNEQAAVNELSSALGTLASDLDAMLAAAQQVRVDMQTQIDGLQSGRAVDKATIAAMQAASDQLESDVIGALTPMTQQVQELDSGLKTPPAAGGTEITPS